MQEFELKSVVPDCAATRARVEAAGGRLVLEGLLEDRRYDTPDGRLAAQDHVLRLRTFTPADGRAADARVDWKGPTRLVDGYKVREELSAGALEPEALAQIVERLGYAVTREIDRDIAQYDLGGATVRFERYPRLDVLVEVEGTPETIERAIAVTGLPREGFTSERLLSFALRYQERTGERAAVSRRELAGDYQYVDG